MKTRREWYNDLPRTHKFKAIKNTEAAEDEGEEPPRLDQEEHSLNAAIGGGFIWSKTPEGANFWINAQRGIYTKS